MLTCRIYKVIRRLCVGNSFAWLPFLPFNAVYCMHVFGCIAYGGVCVCVWEWVCRPDCSEPMYCTWCIEHIVRERKSACQHQPATADWKRSSTCMQLTVFFLQHMLTRNLVTAGYNNTVHDFLTQTNAPFPSWNNCFLLLQYFPFPKQRDKGEFT